MRKNCSSDQEKLLKFEAEGREFAKYLKSLEQFTVFPHLRPAGIIFFQGLQLRVLLERGYYSRLWIILKNHQF